MELEDRSVRWNFENGFCVEHSEIWVHEAINLKNSAQVLNDYTWSLFDRLKDKEEEAQKYPAFWTSRIERMLWGFAFENLFKAIIINELKSTGDIKDVPFNEIKSHALLMLAKKANVELSDDEEFYLGVLELCSVWAGRYPIPTNQSKLPESRKPMKTQEELINRSREQFELLKEGKIKRTIVEDDVLHSGLGTLELELYDGLFSKVQKMAT